MDAMEAKANNLRAALEDVHRLSQELKEAGCRVSFESTEIDRKNSPNGYGQRSTFYYLAMPSDLSVKVTRTLEL